LREGRTERALVAREVILSSGVIETPKLMMLSGIGPAAALKAHGIAVAVDSPGVGANLHDHPRVSLRWRSQKPLSPSSVSAGLFVHSRQLARGPTVGTIQSETEPVEAARNVTRPAPDIQFYVGRGLDVVDEFITLSVALSQPRSRGSITLRSANPREAPVIRVGYFSDGADLEALAEGVRLAQRLAATRAYAGLRGAPVDPAADVQSPDELRAFIRRAADTIFHPVGTCRMGSDQASVVDPTLKVRGIEGLRVADGSVMPFTVNSQTHAACLLIGARAAEFILSE
jgi:choline dehydrogenase